ncbi:MAG TPA: undecaprenyl-diphosphate phosphatase [Acidimicrobiales bacterium]|nr:undecaprenyl-diphosphate phosphatase [Acidimicrobiales bacterium]
MLASISYLQAIVMGLLQGFTELFPISSLGHSVLLPALLGWHDVVNSQSSAQSFFLAFIVGLHVGTALGLLVYYRRTWRLLLGGLVRQVAAVRGRGAASLWRVSDPTMDADYRLLFILAVATIPVGLAGVALESTLRQLFAKPLAAAIFLTVNGMILLVGEGLRRSAGKHVAHTRIATISPRGALAIGLSQVLALFAGISRSGVSMVTGLMINLDHEESANFAFLLATPVILLAGLYKLPELFGPLGNGVRLQTLVGALCAMGAAMVSVRFLTRWFTTKTLIPFGAYSLVLGVACVVRFG